MLGPVGHGSRMCLHTGTDDTTARSYEISQKKNMLKNDCIVSWNFCIFSLDKKNVKLHDQLSQNYLVGIFCDEIFCCKCL